MDRLRWQPLPRANWTTAALVSRGLCASPVDRWLACACRRAFARTRNITNSCLGLARASAKLCFLSLILALSPVPNRRHAPDNIPSWHASDTSDHDVALVSNVANLVRMKRKCDLYATVRNSCNCNVTLTCYLLVKIRGSRGRLSGLRLSCQRATGRVAKLTLGGSFASQATLSARAGHSCPAPSFQLRRP